MVCDGGMNVLVLMVLKLLCEICVLRVLFMWLIGVWMSLMCLL